MRTNTDRAMAGTEDLNERQHQFVAEYLIDLNATKAAERAGYSAKTAAQQGARLLTNVKVAEAIVVGQEERAQRVEVSQDYVLENLTEVVERCMQRAPVMVRRGREMVQLQDDEGRDVWQFNSKGAIGALGLLGKHLGMFVDRHELTGADGAPLFKSYEGVNTDAV